MKKYSHCEVADSSGRKKKSTALFLFSFPSPSLVLRRAERPALFCLRVFFEVWRLCLHVALFQPSGFRYHPPLTPTCFFFFPFLFPFVLHLDGSRDSRAVCGPIQTRDSGNQTGRSLNLLLVLMANCDVN